MLIESLKSNHRREFLDWIEEDFESFSFIKLIQVRAVAPEKHGVAGR
jgi:hypothetical protein